MEKSIHERTKASQKSYLEGFYHQCCCFGYLRIRLFGFFSRWDGASGSLPGDLLDRSTPLNFSWSNIGYRGSPITKRRHSRWRSVGNQLSASTHEGRIRRNFLQKRWRLRLFAEDNSKRVKGEDAYLSVRIFISRVEALAVIGRWFSEKVVSPLIPPLPE